MSPGQSANRKGRWWSGATALGLGLPLLAVVTGGCSLRRMAVNRVGDVLAEPGVVWTGDDDPVLIGDALPFALKTYEGLLAESPHHPGLLLAACSGFASYAAGWVEPEAERLESSDFSAALATRARALRLHLRARDYCLRLLEDRLPGVTAALRAEPASALVRASAADVELVYWTGAAWGSAVALGLDRPDLVADLPAVRALFETALALDPDWRQGSIHEAMISIESVSELLGGSRERAEFHYRRALELSRGRRAGPHVAYARGVLVASQDRREFRETLEKALAIDAGAAAGDRLANLLSQERARLLLSRIDDLFFDEEE